MNSIPTTKRSTMLGLMTHVIVLTIVFILPEVIFTATMGQRAKFGPRRFDIYIHTVMYIITFYVNYFILIDRLLFKKRTWLYLVVAALFAALMVVASSYSHIVIDKLLGVTPPPHRRGHHGGGLFIVSMMTRDYVMLILTIGLSVALKMGLRWTRIEKLNERIITERKDMELRNLKNQLNPHFLFNTLNNIYALTAFDTEKAQNAIHQLSKLLRYTLYESDGTQVTLDKELQFIRSYINLMALRLSDNTRLTVSIHDGGTNGLEIAPMMFISLVENAFKHGVSAGSESFIDIRITLDGNRICCHVENSLFPKQKSDKSGSGIGLANLQRQLELLYPESHDYSAAAIGDRYVAELSITLNATKD